jgi:uncharacterized membrane protein
MIIYFYLQLNIKMWKQMMKREVMLMANRVKFYSELKVIIISFNYKIIYDTKYENCQNFELRGTFLGNPTCKIDNNTYVKYNISLICNNSFTNQN